MAVYLYIFWIRKFYLEALENQKNYNQFDLEENQTML